MANRHQPSRFSKSSSPSEVQVLVSGVRFSIDRKLLAAKSEKFASLLEDNNSDEKAPYLLRDIPVDPEIFQLVGRFCHGFELQLSAENVIPLICISYYLGMTETHSTNNLFKQASDFFKQRILPGWNETLRAIGALSDKVLEQAHQLGLIEACFESIMAKVMIDPRLLGKPIRINHIGEDVEEEDNDFRPNARRKLFAPDWRSEDLTVLPLLLYEPVIIRMQQHGVPSDYVAASIYQYAKKWVFSDYLERKDLPIHQSSSMRETMEVLERLLPCEPRLIPCRVLFEMLRISVALEASSECRDGFEAKIGKQLDQATAKDLLIPFQGYAKEGKYDIGCVKRILKNFYNSYSASNALALISVANLIEDFLAEVATDEDLEVHAFIALADMAVAASLGNHPSSDGMYKAIDIYLDKHGYLTETEKEDICRMLDCQKMSTEACAHAARNERLPLRVVVQVLFMEQLKLRNTVVKEFHSFENRSRNEEDEEDDRVPALSSCGEEELRVEMERMNNKVVELEKECSIMKKEIECHNECSSKNVVKKRKGGGMWGEIKRKFGCIGSSHDCNCQLKKKKTHPRIGFQ